MPDVYPRILQVEPTNACNLNCIMCVRRTWDARVGYMDPRLYERLAEEAFPHLERLTLYGLGEPTSHPNFVEMVEIARRRLPEEATIFFSTNGTLLGPRMADRLVLDLGVDSISFSIDTADAAKLSRIREGARPGLVLSNLRHVGEIKGRAPRDFTLAVEAVLMRQNLDDLPDLVRTAADLGVDEVYLSHVVPYTRQMYEMAVYLTFTREALELAGPILEDEDRVKLALSQEMGIVYAGRSEAPAREVLLSVWDEALGRGLWLNLPMMREESDRLRAFERAASAVEEAAELADELGVRLHVPPFHPDARERSCPYVESDAAVVRWDGKVAPCLDFMYTHPMWVNGHLKLVREVYFGDLNEESLADVWNSPEYVEFRRARRSMSAEIPWCGDCPYSTQECWFTRSNEVDCRGNSPHCGECLYSVGISRCLI